MEFEAHGKYDLTCQGEIVVIRLSQSWNLEGAKAFFKEYQALILQQNLKKFGVLSDFRQFEGGTPDAISFFDQISKWAKGKGQVARAQIVDSSLKAYTIDQADKGKDLFKLKTFSNTADAFTWLAKLGLAVK